MNIIAKITLIASMPLLLTACNTTKMKELRAGGTTASARASDAELCKVALYDREKTPDHIIRELKSRKLRDCSNDELECRQYGFEGGTPEMARCRLEVANAAKAERNAKRMARAIEEQNSQPTRCTSIAGPGMVNTTCY